MAGDVTDGVGNLVAAFVTFLHHLHVTDIKTGGTNFNNHNPTSFH